MLLIDCGNSATKCRLIDEQMVSDEIFILTDAAGKQSLAAFLALTQPDQVYVASVASAKLTHSLMEQLLQILPRAQVRQLVTEPRVGEVTNAYADYTCLGVDRWLTLLAAQARESVDTIIIDAGSAITIDLLSQQHSHLGGAILPGFNTSRQRFIEMFPSVDFNHPDIAQNRLPGRSTEACIQMTEFPISVSYILQLVSEWSELLQQPLKILLCGQDAGLISAQLKQPFELVPDLVFQGMLQQIHLQG
jgi:type III pantothenate kinase